ncbi:hypothetical protein J8281_07755 [Aquimarina sp. U1-2]|uniref:MORN repeat-containing protein n=1 Tax=Aquimarina sp. U1-2 TaxID=2823141 RepID=UPI001AECA3AC|nr:hypothetical protein [Aquimarina sp. U1-2]MBP2832083.1 hypothetical protein [Aquimarina sp. U1-2]
MTKKRKKYPIYLLLITLSVIAAFFIFRTGYLLKRVKELELVEEKHQQFEENYQKLGKVDSLLSKGSYQEALSAYKNIKNYIAPEDNFVINGRIQFTEELIKMKDRIKLKYQEFDSIFDSQTSLTSSQENLRGANSYDSLNFALEKTKIQLNNIKNQLREKSFGEYLTFKSKKGNSLYYVGEVKDGKANGFGIAILDTGSRYEGEWKNNLRHGKGSFFWIDGQRYEGEYVDDLREGQGTYYWPNGEKYTGQWKNDMRSGSGRFFNKEGDMTTGFWKEDKLVEQLK